MKRIITLIFVLATLDFNAGAKPKLPEIRINWEQPSVLGKGGYPRVHRLNDGRLMCSYCHAGNGIIRYSSNNGKSWSEEEIVVRRFDFSNGNGTTTVEAHNPETVQLSASHPVHPGRLIYAVNLRPAGKKSTVHPYAIAYAISDDNGASWSDLKVNFMSEPWDSDTSKGCWEPFTMELPDGTVQMYFSDETPYYREGNRYQNISVMESSDGADNWTSPRIVCYTPKFRDGMPVTLIHDGKIYLSIESNNVGVRLRPQVLYTTLEDNWKNTVGENSPQRFNPFLESLDSPEFTTGAPYLIQTDNFFVISYQTSENADIKVSRQRIMEVQACRKSEMKKNRFGTMRGKTHPIDVDPTKESVMWNSLSHIGGDDIIACCGHNGKVTLVVGHLSCAIRE